MSISLVAGLGNPGREYEATRHNLGFFVIDALARRQGLTWQKQRAYDAETIRWERAPGQGYLLVKPLTYMNESGRSLQSLGSFYRIPPTSMVVLYDDLNIDLGLVKISITGSAGGHNGVASLLQHLGDGFIRYRLGVGPKQPPQMDLKDFVLGKFTPAQQTIIDQSLDHYLSGLQLLLDQGTERAMNTLNRREKNEPK
jgi:PTH1 family peptidyl-tRNA hydrolase